MLQTTRKSDAQSWWVVFAIASIIFFAVAGGINLYLGRSNPESASKLNQVEDNEAIPTHTDASTEEAPHLRKLDLFREQQLTTKVENLERRVQELTQRLQYQEQKLSTIEHLFKTKMVTDDIEEGEMDADTLAIASGSAVEFSEQKLEEEFQYWETRFSEEQEDLQWSQEATIQIQEAFAFEDIAAAGMPSNIQCQSTMCRVEVETYVPAQAIEIETALTHRLAETLPSVTIWHIEDSNGWARTVMFLSREGRQPEE